MRIQEKNHRFTNKLVRATSPYLRQHAHNPVFWYPWGEEALEQAKVEDKPILLSIGYSTCYWCHVMEREVFENPSIASLMNEKFINIKVDREEHPQLDEIYMTARQLMTHEGGWPNNVFLTPDLKPFYAGGTYGATEAYGKPAFPRLLDAMYAQWMNERGKTMEFAEQTLDAMQHFMVAKHGGEVASYTPMIESARAALTKHYDAEAGGFFRAPKFPQENYLQFLLADDKEDSHHMAIHSLKAMAAGGIQDQVGCGFHRYAVDKNWFVPHFEKMLYTQALLARCYSEAAQKTGNEYLADVAKSICEYVGGAFTDGNGAFYAAIDAETDGVEGAYYAWNSRDLEKILSKEEAAFFIAHYGLADIPRVGNHKHPDGDVVLLRKPMDELAEAQGRPYIQIASMCGQVMNKLLKHRNLHRKPPHLDNKIIVSWNGLMIDALAYAGRVFSRQDYIERAYKAADYLLQYGIDDAGRLVRTVMQRRGEHPATLEDYAYLIKGLLSLHQAIPGDEMLLAAIHLTELAEELFEDQTEGGFFTTQEDDFPLLRVKNGDDGALPNANAIMAENYLTLYHLTGKENCHAQAKKILDFFLSGDSKMWIEFTSMLRVAMLLEKSPIMLPVPEETVLAATATRKNNLLLVEITLQEGWHIREDVLQLSVFAPGVHVGKWEMPPAENLDGSLAYKGKINLSVPMLFSSANTTILPMKVMIAYHPCTEGRCFAQVRDVIDVGI